VETNRLLLRPWREEDGVELQRLFSDPAVKGGRNMPPAIDRTTGSWIGRVGLDELDDWPGVDKVEVGFELHKAWWGRGLATEGALAALEFGFEQHSLHCIISVTAATHVAARRVMEKGGLTYRGTRYWMNPEVPVVWYGIDRAEWKASKSNANTRCDSADRRGASSLEGGSR
jgi:RimJ/RimL family protein N-acetyltransferase